MNAGMRPKSPDEDVTGRICDALAKAPRLPAEPLATRQAWTNHLQGSAMPVLLVSDASVLIDLQRGGILEMVFRLPFEVGVCCGFSMHSRSTPSA